LDKAIMVFSKPKNSSVALPFEEWPHFSRIYKLDILFHFRLL
jgi:hypothetical protein